MSNGRQAVLTRTEDSQEAKIFSGRPTIRPDNSGGEINREKQQQLNPQVTEATKEPKILTQNSNNSKPKSNGQNPSVPLADFTCFLLPQKGARK